MAPVGVCTVPSFWFSVESSFRLSAVISSYSRPSRRGDWRLEVFFSRWAIQKLPGLHGMTHGRAGHDWASGCGCESRSQSTSSSRRREEHQIACWQQR